VPISEEVEHKRGFKGGKRLEEGTRGGGGKFDFGEEALRKVYRVKEEGLGKSPVGKGIIWKELTGGGRSSNRDQGGILKKGPLRSFLAYLFFFLQEGVKVFRGGGGVLGGVVGLEY